jgi:hypothetical protein
MTAPALLERRLRRLLSWYPPRYRAIYEEEMLTVAMDRATPGQQRPSLGEAVSLVRGGLRARFQHSWRGLRTSDWHEAATVFVVFASALLAAMSGGTLLRAVVSGLGPTQGTIAMAIGWSLVLIAACLGWYPLVAGGAALGVAGEGVLIITWRAPLTTAWWPFVLSVVTTVAAALLVRGRAQPVRRIRLAALAMGLLTLAAFTLSAFDSVRYVVHTALGNNGQVINTYYSADPTYAPNLPRFAGTIIVLIPQLAAAAIVVMTALRRPRPVRRRLLLLALPVGLAALMTADGGLAVTGAAPEVQWTILALVPVLGAMLAGLMHTRYEELLHLRSLADYGSGRTREGTA